MGMRALVIWLCTLAGLTFMVTALDRETADIAIREKVPRTPTGHVFRNFAPGQIFHCLFSDLQRIDVWMLVQGQQADTGLTLELRRVPGDKQDRFFEFPVIRTAQMELSGDQRGPQHGVFRFDAISDSKNGVFHFTLVPSDDQAAFTQWAPFVVPRATLGWHRPWGNGTTSKPEPVDFRSTFRDLSMIAIGVDGLDAAAAETYLEVFELPGDGAEPVLVRRGDLHHMAPTQSGYAFFSFDPIPESRYRLYRAVLHFPDNARVMRFKDHPTQEDGVTALTYHGVGKPSPGLLFQSLGRWLLPNRDLVFRAFGEDGVHSNWGKVKSRGARGRFLWALLLWGAAAGGALLLVCRRWAVA